MASQDKSPGNLFTPKAPIRRSTAPVSPSRRESIPGLAPPKRLATEPIIELPGAEVTQQVSAEPANYLVPSRETLLGLSAFIRAVAMQQTPAGFANIDLERTQGFQPPTPIGPLVPPTPDTTPPIPPPPPPLAPPNLTTSTIAIFLC